MRKNEILLVDDDPFILKTMGPALESQSYHVTTAKNGRKAIEKINKKQFDLVITDLVMDDVDGIAVLKKAKELYAEIFVIILTGYGDMTSAIDALRLDADDYIIKPCEAEEIFFHVKRCFEKQELQRKIKLYEKILPICCVCKKIRDDAGKEPGTGNWMEVDEFIWKRTKVDITSTYCSDCGKK